MQITDPKRARFTSLMLAVVLMLSVFGRPAMAQNDPSNADAVRDFIHYTKIAKWDAAAPMGNELLSRNIDPVEFVQLLEDADEVERFQQAIGLARRRGLEMEEVAIQLEMLFEQGKLNRARDPDEIAANIAMLNGTLIGRLRARERLVEAGEYAMPQLLDALLQDNDPELAANVQNLLIDMGRSTIIPLATALPDLDPANQERIINVLGLINYRTSMPFILDVASKTDSPNVRAACEMAIDRLGGDEGLDAAAWYEVLAGNYYEEREELTSFPTDEFQLLWDFDPGIGLVMVPIRTPVYHEAMSMRMSEHSLRDRPANPGALALWIAANFSREIDTPEGYINPAYDGDQREAMYYAVAAGTSITQRVLARALDDRDTPLALKAIAALNKTAGGSTLWAGPAGRQPLLEALQYPNRRVQFEAAIALGKAQPTSAFSGSERVVPTLASAIRDPGSRYAIVLASDRERYNGLRQAGERLGYKVLPEATELSDVADALAETPAVDLVVTDLREEATLEALRRIRANPKLSATPVLCMLPMSTYQKLDRRFRSDQTVELRPEGLDGDRLSTAMTELVERASGGPISDDEARLFAERSLVVLRDLAVSDNQVLRVGDSAMPLISAMNERTGRMKLGIAEVLSRVDQDRTQIALLDAALAASGGERISLLGFTADSAKRYGNMLESRQTTRLIDLAMTGGDQEATAAAAVIGALDLPNVELVPLILGNG